MIENTNEYSTSGDSEKKCVILGCWDYEKTPDLVKDLEISVNEVEKKCKKLLQQLLYYRKYSEQFKPINFKTNLKKVTSNIQKKSQNPQCISRDRGSLPDVSFRKRILNSQQLEEIFHEKFKEKLCTINKELTRAADKIGLKEKMFFFPTQDYLKALNEEVTNKMKKSMSKIRDDFIKMNFVHKSAKSDPEIRNKAINLKYSKITKNELQSYKELSRISLPKCKINFRKSKVRKTVSSPVGRCTLKYQKLRTKIIKKKAVCKNSSSDASEIKKKSHKTRPKDETKTRKKISKTSKKHSKANKDKKKKKFSLRKSEKYKIRKDHYNQSKTTTATTTNSSQELTTKPSPQNHERSYSEIEAMCNSLAQEIHKNNLFKESEAQRETTIEDKSNLKSPLLKQPIPFISRTSTSKSYNIGTNIQQFLSLKKYKPSLKSSTPISAKNSEKKGQHIDSKLFDSNQFNDYHQQKPQTRCSIPATYPWNSRGSECSDFQRQKVSHMEHKENVWISKVTSSSNERKARSKFTGHTPQSYVEYHKSTTRRYTNGQESMIKSESKSAYAVGSKIMVSDCQKTDFYKFEKNNNFCENACGDNYCREKCTKLRSEWSKVYNTFLNLHRRYNTVKEEIINNKLTPSELKSLEDEIDYAVEKYKEFLTFYSKFLHLKNELKSMKIACETGTLIPVTTLSSNCQNLLCFKPTSSMAFKNAFRHIQTLQDNIKRLKNY